MNDWIIFATFVVSFGTCAYIAGHSAGYSKAHGERMAELADIRRQIKEMNK